MQSLSANVCLVLCAIASFVDAVHHHHSHRRPSGYDSLTNSGSPSLPGSDAAPFPSGTPSNAPYPVGNATVGRPTGTGTGSISTTITISIQSTIYLTVPEGGPSPTSAGGAGGSGEAVPPASGAPISALPGDSGIPGEGASSCASPVTVTITTDTTVTLTQLSSPSESPIGSQAPIESPSAATSQPPIQSPVPVGSSAPVIPPSSAPIAAASNSAADGLSSVGVVAYQASSSTKNTFVGQTGGQVGYSARTQVASSTSASSTPASVSIASATSAVPVSSSVAASTASRSLSSAPVSSATLTPNGIKAGVAGYKSITGKSSWSQFTPHIGWYSDYWPNTPDSGSVTGVPMLWGDGHQGGDDASRLAAFKALTTTPKYMMGFYEPDWTPPDSSKITSTSAASAWSSLIAPLGTKGTLLGSPSLATQKDESWLTPFEDASEHPTWDYTCIHTNKPNVTGVKQDIEYYLGKYKKPIWVSEFACVDDQTWTPCTDANEIKTFIQEVVAFLQGHESVVAYGYSNGNGLGTAWPMIDSSTGAITASGQVYLDTISAL